MPFSLQKNLSHLGIILMNLSILSLFLLICLFSSQILILLIYLLLCIIGLLSLLTLFFVEDFRKLFDVTNSFNELLNQAHSYVPMLLIIGASLVFCSILCFIPDYKFSKKKLVFCGFILILYLIFSLLYLGGGF